MSPRDAFGRGQTILLLGGHSDIGRAIVRRLVADGARQVILGSRDPDRTNGPTLDAEVDHRYFDATDSENHETFFEEVFADYPSIDTVIVAFGVLRDQDEVANEPALGVEMAEVNYVGALSSLLHV
ncbi:MAG: SDR family NAD(P)-dependent oxidoreductase, partial [Actinomycetota bacterium]